MIRPSVRPLRWLLAVALVATTAGCFRGFGTPRNPFNTSDGAPGELSIRIENQNFNDVTVYALRGGERLRLGNVTGKSEEGFTLRWDFTLGVEFDISFIGGGRCSTRQLSVAAGDAIWVVIPANTAASPCRVGK
ncbi:MAG: hypothetical protein RJQ04_00685 [Longimicrobiales bacterium]